MSFILCKSQRVYFLIFLFTLIFTGNRKGINQPLRHSVPPPLAGEAQENALPLKPPLVRGGVPQGRRGLNSNSDVRGLSQPEV